MGSVFPETGLDESRRGMLRLGELLCLALAVVLLAWASDVHAAKGLRAEVPELCYQCHVELKEELARKSVHFPFQQGMCGSCHAVHASDKKALVRDSINPLCLSCHNDIKNLLDKGGWHTALRQGSCTDCHYPHSGENRNLLVTVEKDLCWNCHGDLKEQLDRTYKHSPFQGGECASCHNPHASVEQYQMVDAPNKVCQRCHAPGCNVDGVSITQATSKMNCIQCHSGHNSQVKGLFGPYGHQPFLDKACELCHNTFKPGGEVTTLAEGQDLCFYCHEKDPANFHDDDVHMMVTDTSCFLCHDYHASGQETLTVDESRVCFTCHGEIQEKIDRMKRSLDYVHRERECFDCHKPMHSTQPRYFKADVIQLCSMCHQAQHSISHPIGEGVIDPRDGQTLTCISCHSMHVARADFMLQFDRARQLCIQCHKV